MLGLTRYTDQSVVPIRYAATRRLGRLESPDTPTTATERVRARSSSISSSPRNRRPGFPVTWIIMLARSETAETRTGAMPPHPYRPWTSDSPIRFRHNIICRAPGDATRGPRVDASRLGRVGDARLDLGVELLPDRRRTRLVPTVRRDVDADPVRIPGRRVRAEPPPTGASQRVAHPGVARLRLAGAALVLVPARRGARVVECDRDVERRHTDLRRN